MVTVLAERKRPDPANGRESQRRIKMWKQITAARGLIAQCASERIGIDCYQKKPVLPGKMPRSSLIDLFSRRKMEVPIKNVDGRAREKTGL